MDPVRVGEQIATQRKKLLITIKALNMTESDENTIHQTQNHQISSPESKTGLSRTKRATLTFPSVSKASISKPHLSV